MADVPERLFRDEAGAAFERVARLEQENQELRAELRRFERPDEVPTLRTRRPKPQPWFFIVGAVAGVGLAFGLPFLVAGGPERLPSERFTSFPPSVQLPTAMPPGLIGASPVPTVVATADTSDDCETPYTYDAQGTKHYKQECIHPERAK